jgi:hypothetical protein
MTNKKYTNSLLNKVIIRDNAELIGNYIELTKHTKITYKCSCGTNYSKSFLSIIKYNGAVCNLCSKKITTKKIEMTNINKYGVKSTLELKEIKDKIISTNMERYGVKTPFHSSEIQNKIKLNIKDKYGVDNVLKLDSIKEKIVNTNIEKYNTPYLLNSSIIRNKIISTNIERYGVKSTLELKETKDKIMNTNLERYGVKYIFQSSKIREKIISTNLERYGVENPQQNQEINEKTQKNSKKYKEYIMPSGEVRKVQGYEPFALRDLLHLFSFKTPVGVTKKIWL